MDMSLQPAAGHALDDDPQFHQWLRYYYLKWQEVTENQRWISSGRGPKYPTVLAPFMPFGHLPAIPFNNFMTTLVDTQVCKLADARPNPLGQKGHMATLIRDPNNPNQFPFVLFETVWGGIVNDYWLFRDKTWSQIAAALRQIDVDPDCYKKAVDISFLRELYRNQSEWFIHGNNRLFLASFIATVFDAIKKKTAWIDPKPQLFENLERLGDPIKFEDVDVAGLMRGMSRLLPNLTIEVRGGDLPLDLGAPYTLVLTEEAVLALFEGLKLTSGLAEMSKFMAGYLSSGVTRGWVKIEGARWLSRISARLLRRRVRGLPKKMQILSKIMANPFLMLLVGSKRALLVKLKEGWPESIKKVELMKSVDAGCPQLLEEIWKQACEEHGLIHLAARMRPSEPSFSLLGSSLLDISILEKIEYFPRNDFIRHLVRRGPFQIFLDLTFPFLSA